MRDPHEAIREGENALRALIEDRLEKALGDTWLLQSGLTSERLARLEERRVEEQKRRPLQWAEERPLYYADVADLRTIISHRWDLIKPVLGDKRETEVFLDKLEDLRNPDSHQRSLWPYEVDLVFGISGHFRQALAVARSEADELDRYYPRFERVVDSFGDVISHPETSSKHEHSVRSGSSISYQIEAWNPDTQPLKFSASLTAIGRELHPRTTATQLTVTLEPDDIDRTVAVVIRLHRADSKKPFDEHVFFWYRGIPIA